MGRLILARKKGESIAAYKQNNNGEVDLDSVLLFGVTRAGLETIPRVFVIGPKDYRFMRTELLTREHYARCVESGKITLSRSEAERLRLHLRNRYQVAGLEQSLLNGESQVE